MAAAYRARIAPLAPDHDARHVEAYMRAGVGTLDHLPPERFEAEVAIALYCIKTGGLHQAEQLAKSFGL